MSDLAAARVLPLSGCVVAITGTAGTQQSLRSALSEVGATVLEYPLISVRAAADSAALDRAICDIAQYDWVVFTSRNAVESVFARAVQLGRRDAVMSCRIAVVGPATASAVMERGGNAAAIPSESRASAIAALLGSVEGLRVLLPRSDLASPELPAELRRGGAVVDDVVAYRTCAGTGTSALASALRDGGLGVIAFTSGSAVRSFVDNVGAELDLDSVWLSGGRPRIACIGPATAARAGQLGVPVDVVASDHDANGLASAITSFTAGQDEQD